jgi:hypothetical protein
VAEHTAALPLAAWEGQLVPPLPQQAPPAYPVWQPQVPPAYLEYPAWAQQGPRTLPTVVDLTQDEDEQWVAAPSTPAPGARRA